jgi:hypothetical protein
MELAVDVGNLNQSIGAELFQESPNVEWPQSQTRRPACTPRTECASAHRSLQPKLLPAQRARRHVTGQGDREPPGDFTQSDQVGLQERIVYWLDGRDGQRDGAPTLAPGEQLSRPSELKCVSLA